MAEESLLVVDDDRGSSSYAALVLRQSGYKVRTANDGAEALRAMESELPALVISDLQMPSMDGLQLLSAIKQRWPHVIFMLMTVEADVATAVSAIQQGAINYLVKPVSPSGLQLATAKALAHARQERLPTLDPLDEIVGESPTVARVREDLILASRSDVNVLLVGETGTGKELAARALHRLSGLSTGPFIAHNCAVTPAEMFDSEFFGHRRGAFTGADRDRTGLLREAHAGVLFLDELECLGLANQAKLLRVLDDGEIRPLGAEQSRSVSVRFVAATNRRPEDMLFEKHLREDLYYRLRGFQIDLPPLRERTGDIPLLIEHFLGEHGATRTARAEEALARCRWPGNVRQLRNVLRRARAIAGRQAIDTQHLDLTGCGDRLEPQPLAPPTPPEPMPSPSVEPPTTLQNAERQAIEQAIRMHNGNVSRAAEYLGIHRSTLRRKLRELGIDRGG